MPFVKVTEEELVAESPASGGVTPPAPAAPKGRFVPVVGETVPPTAVGQSEDDLKDPLMRMAEADAVKLRTEARKARQQFLEANKEKGVELDLDTSLPAGMRARLSIESDPDKQVGLLKALPGVLGVRKAADKKNVIVRFTPEDGGKPRDVLLNPMTPTLTMRDVAGAAAPIAKAAATTGTALATGGAPLWLQGLALFGTAAGLEAGSKTSSRALAGQPLDLPDIAGSAATEGAIEAAMPFAPVAGRGVLNLVAGRGQGPTETLTKVAAKALDLPLTPSMARDSKVLRAIERPLGEGQFVREQEEALSIAKKRQLGAGALSEEEVAERVGPIFAETEQLARQGVTQAKERAANKAYTEIQGALDRGFVPAGKGNSEVGAFLREKIAGSGPESIVTQLRTGDEQLFGVVNQLATKEGLVVKPDAVVALADKLDTPQKAALLEIAPGIKKIPRIADILTKGKPEIPGEPGQLFDASGRIIVGPATPATPPPALSLSDARELRREIFNLANDPGAPGQMGVSKEKLMQLYAAIDDDMASAVGRASPDLQAANQAAETFHKTKIQPLQQSDVAKLFLKTDAAGRLEDDEIVRRLFRGEGNLGALKAYRNVLGADSPEWKLLVRTGVENLLDESGRRLGRIRAKDFLSRMEKFAGTEFADEILGPAGKEIVQDARLMAKAQDVEIPEADLLDALASGPKDAVRLLNNAIAREQAYKKEFQGNLQRQLRDGTLGPRTLGNADEFVTRLIFKTDASEDEVTQALIQIAAKDPKAAESIRQITLRRMLDDAGAKVEPEKLSNEMVRSDKLKEMVEGDAYRNARAAIGKPGVQFLDDLKKYALADEKRLAGVRRTPSATEEAGRIAAAGMGSQYGLGRTLADIAAFLPRLTVGTAADRIPLFRNYLATGELPTLTGGLQKGARVGVLAAPAAAQAVGALAESDNDPNP